MGEIAKFVGYIVLGLIAFGIYAQWKEKNEGTATPANLADCRIVAVDSIVDTYIINNNPDFGYTIRTTIRNIGQEGQLKVRAFLSTSEGNFERSQALTFQSNQEAALSYQFPEPSINATGVQSRITCSPSTAGSK